MIAPERFLAHPPPGNGCLRCVKTCRDLVCSLADFATRRRTHRLFEKLHRTCQKRFNGLRSHGMIAQYHPSKSKTKFKPHRSDRVRRKR